MGVIQAAESIQKTLMEQREIVSCLAERLTPVLGPERPEPGESEAEKMPEESPLTMSLRHTNEDIQHSNRLLKQLIDRLEV